MKVLIEIDENCYNDCRTMAILSAEQGQPRLGYIYEKIADGIVVTDEDAHILKRIIAKRLGGKSDEL